MRDITSIIIEELILHILDPQGQGLVLSNLALPVNENQAILDYFSRHILNSFKERGIKAARFKNINPDQPSGVCRDLLRKDVSLVDGSQSLARALYSIMEEDRRITAGDLAVCLFRADNYPYTNFLAILKVDPSKIFRHVMREDDQGNTYVAFEAEQHAFTDERLQKCAFIQPLDPRHPEYDMLLLDRQRWDAKDGRIARFFSEAFLDATETFDSRKYTENLYKGLVAAQNVVRDRLTIKEEEDFTDQINSAITSRRLNLDTWLDDLPLADDIKQEIDQSISPGIPEREFSIDRSYSTKIMSKVKFRGDNRLKIEVPFENYRQMLVSEEYVTGDPNREPYYRIVIETEIWKRVT
jgi:hypothetical protein